MECQNCAFNPVVQAISSILQTYTVVIDKKNIPLNAIEYMVHRHKKTNVKISKVASALLQKFSKLREFIETEMLPLCQDICMTCAKNSNDDNLSRGGQTIVFMEAMPGAAGELAGDAGVHCSDGDYEGQEGAFPSGIDNDREFFEDEDDTISENKGNWLNTNAITIEKSGVKEGVSKLPTGVENELKHILSCFKDMTILQQCVLLQRWNEMSFVDIGSMTWVPEEFRRHNDKQLVSFWWKQIVKKFPWADALSSKKKKRGDDGKGDTGDDDYKTRSPKETYCEQELDFGSML